MVVAVGGVQGCYADDQIILFNHADTTVYAALYYVESNLIGVSTGPASRYGEVIEIPAYTERKLTRPPWKFFTHNREIIFSTSRDMLPEKLEKKEYKVSSSKSAGQKYGSRYHITKSFGILSIHGDLDYMFLQPVEIGATEVVMRVFHKFSDYYKQHPYANVQANVRKGFDLSSDENSAIAERDKQVKNTLEAVLKKSLPRTVTPRIGLAMSGGGVRAAVCAYGLMAGLQDIGLLDAVTYAVGLSGSTWLLSSFLENGTSIQDFKENFLKAVTTEHIFSANALSDSLLQKFINKQPLSIVDVYGVYLATKFFVNVPTDFERQRVLFSQLKDRVSDGSFMFPLCTAVDMTMSGHSPAWFSFSPYEIGSDELGLYIPTWSFGRKFNNGVSAAYENPPEYRLGYFMGIWGSALSGTFKRMYEIGVQPSIENPFVRSLAKNVLKQTMGSVRFAPVDVPNPFYGLEQRNYRDLKYIKFVDAGVAFNLPIVPLMHKQRAVDIIIVLDSSQNVHKKAGDLQKAEAYMKEKGYPFPRIDYTDITKKAVNLFIDKDPAVPVVIYIVPVKNSRLPELGDPEKEFYTVYQTTNFSYKRKDAERLIDLVRSNIVDNKELIMDAIKQKINQKMEKIAKNVPMARRKVSR